MPEALAEAELFGYRRGAFTGADRANLGFFRSADQGTLLLDEVADLPLAPKTICRVLPSMTDLIPEVPEAMQEELTAFLMRQKPIFTTKNLGTTVTQMFEKEHDKEQKAHMDYT